MPSRSKKQARFMRIAAHDAEFAKKVGIDQNVAREFYEADKAKEQSSNEELVIPIPPSDFVFLGGTSTGYDWRGQLIPTLTCQYFNPIVKDWTEACKANEDKAKEEALMHLYVITPDQTGLYSIAELTEQVILEPYNTVVAFLSQAEGQSWDDAKTRSNSAIEALLAKYDAKVFKTLDEVSQYLNDVCQHVSLFEKGTREPTVRELQREALEMYQELREYRSIMGLDLVANLASRSSYVDLIGRVNKTLAPVDISLESYDGNLTANYEVSMEDISSVMAKLKALFSGQPSKYMMAEQKTDGQVMQDMLEELRKTFLDKMWLNTARFQERPIDIGGDARWFGRDGRLVTNLQRELDKEVNQFRKIFTEMTVPVDNFCRATERMFDKLKTANNPGEMVRYYETAKKAMPPRPIGLFRYKNVAFLGSAKGERFVRTVRGQEVFTLFFGRDDGGAQGILPPLNPLSAKLLAESIVKFIEIYPMGDEFYSQYHYRRHLDFMNEHYDALEMTDYSKWMEIGDALSDQGDALRYTFDLTWCIESNCFNIAKALFKYLKAATV